MSDHQDRYLTTKDVARLLHITVSCLEKWRGLQKGPPFVRVGSRIIRYELTAVVVWAGRQS
jgi:hypothetical protein